MEDRRCDETNKIKQICDKRDMNNERIRRERGERERDEGSTGEGEEEEKRRRRHMQRFIMQAAAVTHRRLVRFETRVAGMRRAPAAMEINEENNMWRIRRKARRRRRRRRRRRSKLLSLSLPT